MDYNTHDFKAGDILKADQLNEMDDAIKELAEGGSGGGGVGKKTESGGEIFNSAKNAGQYAHAEGYKTTASGASAHAEGVSATASGSYAHAEGNLTTASGESAHAEGSSATALGEASHAEGNLTTASGDYAHAEGYKTTASGGYAHAGGRNTVASGLASHAGGEGTIASQRHQTVIGKFNVEDTTNQYAFIIGDGTDDTHRHNLFAVGWNGKVYVNGTAIN